MLPRPHFTDRYDAGRRLGIALRNHTLNRPIIVLGLPRGGVPVAARVAEELEARLDVLIVRKLGVPGREEYAFGAIASGGARVLNPDVIRQLGISREAMGRVVGTELAELHRRDSEYRGNRRFPELAGHTVVLVDDGAATGTSMFAAITAVRELAPRAIVAAVPVASRDALRLLGGVADGVVCIVAPEPFDGVGLWYEDFSEVPDAEVRVLLADAWRRAEDRPRLDAHSVR